MADAFTSETYNALCRDAEGYLARGLAEQARELLLKATSLIGTRPRARSLLADACMQLGLWGEAKSQLEALSTLEVDNIYTHFRLGQVLEETGETELARDNFRVVLDMNPDHHGAKVALARLEKETDETPPEKTPPAEGQQIFADSDDTESIFAGEGSDGVDDLLNNIGLGENREVAGVDDLLNSIGINEEKKEEPHKVDFGAIFGGGSQTSVRSEPEEEESPLASVFSGGKSELPESHTDLNSIFGATAAEEEPEPEPEKKDTSREETGSDLNSIFGATAAKEEPEPEPEEKETGTDLNAIFGESTQAVKKAEEVAEPEEPTREEPVIEATVPEDAAPDEPDEPVEIKVEVPIFPEEEPEAETDPATPSGEQITDIDSIFGAFSGETAPEEKSDADLNAIFGTPETPEVEEEPATEEEPPEEEEAGTDLNAMFGTPETPEVEEEPAAEEEPATEEEPPEEEEAGTDLNAIFGTPEAPEVEEEPAAEEEPATEEEPPEEEEAGTDLNAMFGTPETPEVEEEPAAEEEPPEEEEAGTDLNAMFGTPETPEVEEEPATEEEPPEEEEAGTDLNAMFGGSETPEVADTPEAPAVKPAPEPGALAPTDSMTEGQTEGAVELAEGAVEAPEEETGEVMEPGSLAPTDSMMEDVSPGEIEEAEETSSEEASYQLLPGDCSSLCALKLDSGGVRVLGSMVTAVSGTIELIEDILTGKGVAWFGQGTLTPVVVEYSGGMTVRIDRLAVRPIDVSSVSCGLESVPALRKLEGDHHGSLLMFIAGRLKKLSVSPGLRVRTGSVLAADPGVVFAEAEDGFLAVAGAGRVIIAG